MIASLIDSQPFIPSPRPGVGVMGGSYYATNGADKLVSIHSYTSRSDTVDVAYVRRSDDGGVTWSPAQEWPTRFKAEGGTGRRHPRGGYVDAATGRYIQIWTEGVLPGDDPLEGMWRWKLHYAVSQDGGRTRQVEEQIIHQGPDYNAEHHLPGITVGRNCAMVGDLGQRPLTRSDGVILMPIQSSPVGSDGHYHNPGAGYTYTDCLLLMGRWRTDGGLDWTCSQRVSGDPDRTTRGLIEPTIAELADGRLLMVMRGSNDVRPQWPGHKWMALSADGGDTWNTPTPWTYDNGEPFFSPSACSQLIPHQSGRLFWMGNLCGENPQGNRPRYPLVLGQVDRTSGLLMRQTITPVDDRRPGEGPRLTLSNFYVRQERPSGDLLVHLPRFFAADLPDDSPEKWTADLLLHRLRLH
ncbi:MAG: hypothetical protein GKR89_17595 [Candidatus Latescibacteria bacterium]|nr:hypothetical protein [Candidatus Latescibacterota bacterium]